MDDDSHILRRILRLLSCFAISHIGKSVVAYRWDGATLVADGTDEAAGVTDNDRPLAVAPAPGLRPSYLVVGT